MLASILLFAACSSTVNETGSGGATTTAGACGAATCAAGQLCVVPGCTPVPGEECVHDVSDGGAQVCPPGTQREPGFDADCAQGDFACVSACPPPMPFCVDLPAACGGVPTCACLGSNPCAPSNSGACRDMDIVGKVLTCSLMP